MMHDTNLLRHIDPGKVREVRVCGDSNNLTIKCFKFCHAITEGNQLSRTNEGAGQEGKKCNELILNSFISWLMSRHLYDEYMNDEWNNTR